MSATIILAKQEPTGFIQHIYEVDKKQRLIFTCVGCGKEMVVVKSESRKKDWHFRHNVESNCTADRDRALHDYAVQVLMDNAEVRISKKLQIAYSNPQKEVSIFGKRSDVTVTNENEEVHFEIFVTHDIDQEKVAIYKSNKVKSVRIDLSEPDLLTAMPERIKDEVLIQYKNKTIVYWQDETLPVRQENKEGFKMVKILLGLITAIGIGFLIRRVFLKGKNR